MVGGGEMGGTAVGDEAEVGEDRVGFADGVG